jgi:hypothetical protein
MNVLTRLWRAVAGLAESVEALARTVGEANGQLRQQLALGGPGEARGEVIENAEALPAPRRCALTTPLAGGHRASTQRFQP